MAMSEEVKDATLADLRSELKAMNAQLTEIVQRLNVAFAGPATPRPNLSIKATRAIEAREVAKARGFHTVTTFARVVGRHENWVAARCKARVIQVLPGGKPYKIPLVEEIKYNGPN